MVRIPFAALLLVECATAVSVLSPAATAVSAPAPQPPTAAQVLSPAQQFLPGYRLPWQLDGKIRRYRSEAEWRKDNPNFIERGRQMAAMLRQLPENEWRTARVQITEQSRKVQTMGLNPSGSGLALLDPANQAFLDAALKCAGKSDAAQALTEHFHDLVDGAVIEYITMDRPDLVAQGKPPAGTATFKIYLEIWTEPYMRQHANQIDLDSTRFEALLASGRQNARAMLAALVPMAAKKAEAELYKLYGYNRPKDYGDSIQKQRDILAGLAACKLTVTGSRPALGDGAHIMLFKGPGPLDDKPVGVHEGTAQVRRGRAVFKVSFTAAGTFANLPFDQSVERLLKLLADRAGAFELAPLTR
jgi:hypothetical protein